MLQAMRKKMHGWPSIVLLGVAVFAMSFFGIETYFMSNADSFVAKVNKHEITQRDYQDRVNLLRQQMSAQQGDQFDSSAFEKPEVKLQILDGMIDEQLLLQANDDWGMRVPSQSVRDYIAGIPAFQVNGQFDATSYRAWLTSQRKTPGMFEQEIRSSLAGQLLPDAINNSTLVTTAQIDRFVSLLTQSRNVSYFVIPPPMLDEKVSVVTDEQIAAYYKAHQADYMNPEQVSVKFIEVNSGDLKLDAELSDEDLHKRYDEEKQRFVQPEQRLASHILINVPANATPEQQKAALAKADKIAAEANASDFAKLAEADSQDLGSKRQGGDLGWLEKGVTNPAFDSALFALQKGQVSKPILSSDGYHIIWLRDVRSGESKPFAEVRDELVKEASTADRDRKYNEVAGKMSDNTYQNPTSLEPAAAALDLPIKTTELFSRKGGEGMAANAKVIDAAFSDDVLVQGNNSGLIDLGNDHSVVIHVDKHVAAAARPLAEVSAEVKQKILDQRIATAASKLSDEALVKLNKGEAIADVAAALKTEVKTVDDATRQNRVVPPALLKQAFLVPHPKADGAEFAAVAMDDGNYGLLAVNKVTDGDPSKMSPQELDGLRQQVAQAYGSETRRELIEVLRAKAKIKINKNLL